MYLHTLFAFNRLYQACAGHLSKTSETISDSEQTAIDSSDTVHVHVGLKTPARFTPFPAEYERTETFIRNSLTSVLVSCVCSILIQGPKITYSYCLLCCFTSFPLKKF